MNALYIDEFGFAAGEITVEAICTANKNKCVLEPLPDEPLALWHGWRWDGLAWSQQPDNRNRIWYKPDNTALQFRATRPDDTPPAGWTHWEPGQSIAVGAAELLAKAKAAKWAQVKREREAAIVAPLTTAYGVFDADPVGSANIMKSVLLANNLTTLGLPVSIDFTLANNTVVTLDAAAMVAVGLTLAAREKSARALATALRTRIDSAVSQAQIDLIAWEN